MNMRTVFTNAEIISPFRKFKGSVAVASGIIEEVCEGRNLVPAADDAVIDATGLYLSPGFIELHTHGGGGHDFMDSTMEAISGGCRTHLQHGTTAMLPTTLSSSDEELFANLHLIEEAAADKEGMPEILGVHLEGPYFSPQQNAAQDKRYIKHPAPEEYKRIYANCPFIKIWSVAPELPGALEMGRWMRDNGIVASIGHSNAVYEEIVAARENGYTMLTHFFNGMSRLVRKNARMYLGVAESGLCFDDLTAEIIADGCHLPVSLLRLIYKVKGPDTICLVTDSMRAAGQDVSSSILGSKKNGQTVEIEDGVAYMPGRESFGGSIATADRLVRTMANMADIPLTDAVKMMTVVPARILRVDNRIGAIAPGKEADILLFDRDINIRLVMIKGKVWNK
jgi:N-acetylglucosamine-6-phosphate deacetylase